MRILGLDLGTRTCGMAICDPLGIIAYGVENFRFRDGDYEAAKNEVLRVIKENNITEIVLGLPLHMNGDHGDKAKICEEFEQLLKKSTDVPVKLMDERLTTVVANKRLLEADLSRKKRKQVIDKMAAVEILQNYLDMKKMGGH